MGLTPPSLSSIRYALVENAVEIIRSLGQETLLMKFDLKNAYPYDSWNINYLIKLQCKR